MSSQVTPRWEIPPYKLRRSGCRNAVDAIECKWNPTAFDAVSMATEILISEKAPPQERV
jgi:hypothetical protein